MKTCQNALSQYRREGIEMKNDVSIGTLASDFINHKHALGYTYRSQKCIIRRYVSFHIKHSDSIVPDKSVVQAFLEDASNTAEYIHCIVSVLREFCKYLYSIGYEETYLIRSKIVGAYTPNPPYFLFRINFFYFPSFFLYSTL